MKASNPTGTRMRVLHRYLGFFLAGIMATYALSGVVLIFRNTDFLKREVTVEKTLPPDLDAGALGEQLRIKRLEVTRTAAGTDYFAQGSYVRATGVARYTTRQLPYVLERLTRLHKSSTDHPLYWLNVFFGLSLLFFVVSAFWMFLPATRVFRKGLYFALAGLLLTLALLFV